MYNNYNNIPEIVSSNASSDIIGLSRIFCFKLNLCQSNLKCSLCQIKKKFLSKNVYFALAVTSLNFPQRKIIFSLDSQLKGRESSSSQVELQFDNNVK